MKKILLPLLAMWALCSFSSLFAIEVSNAPEVKSVSETSLSVDWEDVSGALGYYIYYSKETWIPDGYSFEWIDLIESSETVLENLDADTDYYIALTVVDDNGNESQYSPEAFYTTSNNSEQTSALSSFAVESVVVLSANTLEITFSSGLDTTENATREFKLTEKDSGSEVSIVNSSLIEGNTSKVAATTEVSLIEEKDYNLTILSIQDSEGNNIEAGIDGITTFSVPRWSTTSYEEITEVPEVTVDLVDEEDNDLNAAWVEITDSKAGQSISDEEITKTAEMAAKDNEELPETGPETILLLLLAIILGGWLFFLHSIKA